MKKLNVEKDTVVELQALRKRLHQEAELHDADCRELEAWRRRCLSVQWERWLWLATGLVAGWWLHWLAVTSFVGLVKGN